MSTDIIASCPVCPECSSHDVQVVTAPSTFTAGRGICRKCGGAIEMTLRHEPDGADTDEEPTSSEEHQSREGVCPRCGRDGLEVRISAECPTCHWAGSAPYPPQEEAEDEPGATERSRATSQEHGQGDEGNEEVVDEEVRCPHCRSKDYRVDRAELLPEHDPAGKGRSGFAWCNKCHRAFTFQREEA